MPLRRAGSAFSSRRSASAASRVVSRGQRVVERRDARLGARLDLVVHVDVRGRVVADEHGGEARRDPVLATNAATSLGHLGPDRGGDRPSRR